MSDNHAAATTDLSAPDNLISFLKAIPDGRYRRGVRYPQWFLLLVAVLGIGRGSQVVNAILDKNVRIGRNIRVINKDQVQEGDRSPQGFTIREGSW